MRYLRTVWLHLRKDLLLEWRSRDAITGMLFFTLLVAVVFSIAFDPAANPTLAREIAGGILWVGLLFAASTALNSSWNHETQNQVLDAHRLSPSAPSAFFLGKALANFVFVAVVELVLAPVFTIFFNLHPLGDTRWLWLIMPFGTWALIVNGTFFAALGLRTRNREMLLPLVLIPFSIPALLGVVQATTGVITGEFEPTLWVQLIIAFDVIFTTVGLLLFGVILHAE